MKSLTLKLLVLALIGIAASSSQSHCSADTLDIPALEKSAAAGDADAEFKLGEAYDFGKGVPASPVKAMDLYQKSADQGNSHAENNLGSLYFSGRAGKMDETEAIKWLRKSSEQGDPVGEVNLGILLTSGTNQGAAEALDLFKKAAAQVKTSAYFQIGWIYYMGPKGVQRDSAQAEEWLEKAAGVGDSHSVRAEYVLGIMFSHGAGVKQDFAKSFAWYEKSAEGGYLPAIDAVASAYVGGVGVKKDFAKAYLWSSISAANGDATGENEVKLFETTLPAAELKRGKKMWKEYQAKHSANSAQGAASPLGAGNVPQKQ